MKGTRAVLVLSALISLPTFADEPPPSPTPAAKLAAPVAKAEAKKAAPKPTTGSANMIVTKDAETGELRPATAEERQRLLGRRPLVSVEHKVVTLPDGTSMVELGDADMSYAVASRKAGGSVVRGCVHGDAAAKAAISTSPAPSSATPAAKSDR